jgi:hypothetical protein
MIEKKNKFAIDEKIPTVKGYLNGVNEFLDTSVADHFVKDAAQRLKSCLDYYMIEPKQHLETYSLF